MTIGPEFNSARITRAALLARMEDGAGLILDFGAHSVLTIQTNIRQDRNLDFAFHGYGVKAGTGPDAVFRWIDNFDDLITRINPPLELPPP